MTILGSIDNGKHRLITLWSDAGRINCHFSQDQLTLCNHKVKGATLTVCWYQRHLLDAIKYLKKIMTVVELLSPVLFRSW